MSAQGAGIGEAGKGEAHVRGYADDGAVFTHNIRAVHRPDGMPRQILARASLNATTLEEAVTLLSGSDGWHARWWRTTRAPSCRSRWLPR
jgi:hypothetical protein